MVYERPTCCGQGMTLFADLNVAVGVRTNGKPSLYRPQLFDYEPNKLFCHRCESRYEALKDAKGRVIKGEKI